MSCCGQSVPGRLDLRRREIEGSSGGVRVAYLGDNSLRVRGTYTGRIYPFSPGRRIQVVDRMDSRVLLRTRFFRLLSDDAR